MRSNYSREERQKIVEEYIQSGKSQTVFAPEYGIKPNTLSAWVTKYKSAEACQAADVHFVELKSTFIKEKQNMIIRKAGIEIEIPENSNAVIIREILATEIKAERVLGIVDYDYPTFHLTMHCTLCSIISGDLKLLEYEASRWLSKETLHSVNWLPADSLILNKIEEII